MLFTAVLAPVSVYKLYKNHITRPSKINYNPSFTIRVVSFSIIVLTNNAINGIPGEMFTMNRTNINSLLQRQIDYFTVAWKIISNQLK